MVFLLLLELMEVFLLTLGERLRQAREYTELTQVQVKQRTGINNKNLSNYENGVSDPDPVTLKVLADLYKVTTDWLISGENPNFEKYPFTEMTEEDKKRFYEIVNDEKLKMLFENVSKLPSKGKDRVNKYVKVVELEEEWP